MPDTWFSEGEIAGYENRYLITETLYEGRSKYQEIKVLNSKAFGKMLILDGYVQTTEVDEFIYHESLVHVPLILHPKAKNVLIIGGGDGGTLRHVLKHSVERVVMVELDSEVTRVSREFLPSISGDAFDDPRVTLHFDDGAKYVKDPEIRFDVILIDSTDPIGPAEILISPDFYADCFRSLEIMGLLAAQSGTPVYQGPEFFKLNRNLKVSFGLTYNYWSAVPTYPGTLWSFTVGLKGIEFKEAISKDIEPRISGLGRGLNFFSKDYFKGCFLLPKFIEDLKETGSSPFMHNG